MGMWFGSKGSFAADRKSPGQKSKVHTDALEMELDHGTGRMEGQCLEGQFAGRALSSLSQDELLQLLEELRATDPQGAFLIEVRSQTKLSNNSTHDRSGGSFTCRCSVPVPHFWSPPRLTHGAVVWIERPLPVFAHARAEIRGAHRGPQNGPRP